MIGYFLTLAWNSLLHLTDWLVSSSLTDMITLTPSAAEQVKIMSTESDSGKLLRIFVEAGGCSGFEYGMSMDLPKDSDEIGESSGVKYAIERDSLDYLQGSVIHFDDGLSGKGFEIQNPNAQSTCGCGKSFN